MKKGVSVDSQDDLREDPKKGTYMHESVTFPKLQTDFTKFSTQRFWVQEKTTTLAVVELYNYGEIQRRNIDAQQRERLAPLSTFLPIWDVRQSGNRQWPHQRGAASFNDENQFEVKEESGKLFVYRKR